MLLLSAWRRDQKSWDIIWIESPKDSFTSAWRSWMITVELPRLWPGSRTRSRYTQPFPVLMEDDTVGILHSRMYSFLARMRRTYGALTHRSFFSLRMRHIRPTLL